MQCVKWNKSETNFGFLMVFSVFHRDLTASLYPLASLNRFYRQQNTIRRNAYNKTITYKISSKNL